MSSIRPTDGPRGGQSRQPSEDRTPGRPPERPREVGHAALKRSWTEPNVRTWCVVALLILAAAVGVGLSQLIAWRHDTRLNRIGVLIDATLIGGEMVSRRGEKVPAGRDAFLRFTYQGKEHVIRGRMPMGSISFYVDGSTIPIRIDPANPEDWTFRVTLPPLVQEMIGAILLAPMGLVLTLAALMARWRVLRVWRDGTAREAVVIGFRKTALAPSSRIARCANVHGTDKRIFSVLISKHEASLKVDDTLWVVSPPSGQQPALPAAAYQ
jgi:hypothetical protein